MDAPWLNRVPAQLPVQSMKTYALSAPISTHRRVASCAEVGCDRRARGWKTALDVSVPEHAKAANWVRLHSGLKYTVEENGDAVTFTFPAGQNCFDGINGRHTAPLEREPLYIVRGGDFRGNPRGDRFQLNAADWVDDFSTHQQKLADRMEQG